MSPLDSQDAAKIAAAVEERMRDSKPPHPSGERPALTENTTTNLKTVITIAGFAIAVAGMGAIARAAGEDAGTALSENKAQDKAIQTLQIQRAEDKATNQAEHKAMVDLLQQIRDDVKELKAEIKSSKR